MQLGFRHRFPPLSLRLDVDVRLAASWNAGRLLLGLSVCAAMPPSDCAVQLPNSPRTSSNSSIEMSIGAGRPSSSARARRRVTAFVRRPQKSPQHNFQMRSAVSAVLRSLRFCGLRLRETSRTAWRARGGPATTIPNMATAHMYPNCEVPIFKWGLTKQSSLAEYWTAASRARPSTDATTKNAYEKMPVRNGP